VVGFWVCAGRRILVASCGNLPSLFLPRRPGRQMQREVDSLFHAPAIGKGGKLASRKLAARHGLSSALPVMKHSLQPSGAELKERLRAVEPQAIHNRK
jgi:hypothetical protein